MKKEAQAEKVKEKPSLRSLVYNERGKAKYLSHTDDIDSNRTGPG